MMPLVAHAFLENISLLNNACAIFRKHCISGITANENVCKKQVENSTATVTALISKTGYENASRIIKTAANEKITVKKAALKLNLLSNEEFESLISPEAVGRLGF